MLTAHGKVPKGALGVALQRIPIPARVGQVSDYPRTTMPRHHQFLWGLLLAGAAVGATGAIAQERMAGSCPLVVAPSNSELQPKRIPPSQVAGKNAGGCLSPSDAVYGPDGCPLKLCGADAGVIPLPSP
jgi:hypothetical protein